MLFASRDKGKELPKLCALSTTGQEFSTDFPPVVHRTRASSSLSHFRDTLFFRRIPHAGKRFELMQSGGTIGLIATTLATAWRE